MAKSRQNVSLTTPALLLILFLDIMLSGCGHLLDSADQANQSLRRIAERVSDHPREALDSLKMIDRSRLSTADRHYYDLLSIKGADKAYITHTSDSLIIDVIDYYSTHQTGEVYPEALYYGGRVYSDLGDYPTALRYFQATLDLLTEDTDKQLLRCRVLSQTGWILGTLRLYSQAIPYLEESLKSDRVEKDTVATMHDTQLLGTMYLHLKELDKAETRFRQAYRLAQSFTKADIARQQMYIAATKYKKGELDSARIYMTGVIDNISPTDRHTALSYFGYIYLDSHRPDSAYFAAMELIGSTEIRNKDKGYFLLTSPLMGGMVAQDSLVKYLREYHNLISRYLNTNSNQQSLIQHSSYNYSLHKREREKAESAYDSLQRLLAGILIAVLIIAIILLGVLYYKKDRIVRLLHAFVLLREGQAAHHLPLPSLGEPAKEGVPRSLPLPSYSEYAEESPSDTPVGATASFGGFSLDPVAVTNSSPLKLRLIEELTALNDSLTTPYTVPEPIILSEAYGSLVEYVRNESPVPGKSHIWAELEKIVTRCFPDFKRRLNILTGGNLSLEEFRFTLLIKCNFSSVQISILQGRGKSTIVYRHNRLSLKIFGKKLPLSKIWRLIQQL